MPHGLPLRLNQQFVTILESIENGSSVEEFPLTMTKFVKFKTQQTSLYVKLNVHSMKN